MRAFADRGFHGTPTTEVAKAAGISQAYLFRLFPTKTELFVAVVGRCHERILAAFRAAAAEAHENGADIAPAMGEAYARLLEDRDLLLVQLHAHAASSEPAIRAAVRQGFADLHAFVAPALAGSEETPRAFFARGMLMNVVAATGAVELDEPWTRDLVDPC